MLLSESGMAIMASSALLVWTAVGVLLTALFTGGLMLLNGGDVWVRRKERKRRHAVCQRLGEFLVEGNGLRAELLAAIERAVWGDVEAFCFEIEKWISK